MVKTANIESMVVDEKGIFLYYVKGSPSRSGEVTLGDNLGKTKRKMKRAPNGANKAHIDRALALEIGQGFEIKTVEWAGKKEPHATLYYFGGKQGKKFSVHQNWGGYVIKRIV